MLDLGTPIFGEEEECEENRKRPAAAGDNGGARKQMKPQPAKKAPTRIMKKPVSHRSSSASTTTELVVFKKPSTNDSEENIGTIESDLRDRVKAQTFRDIFKTLPDAIQTAFNKAVVCAHVYGELCVQYAVHHLCSIFSSQFHPLCIHLGRRT